MRTKMIGWYSRVLVVKDEEEPTRDLIDKKS